MDSAVISLTATLRRTWPAQLRFHGAKQAAAYPRLSDGPSSRLFCLAPDGVFRAAPLARDAVGSYPTFSPLPKANPAKPFRAKHGPASGSLFSVTLSVGAP